MSSTVNLYAGHMGIEHLQLRSALKPCIAWAIVLKNSDHEIGNKITKWKRVLGIGQGYGLGYSYYNMN